MSLVKHLLKSGLLFEDVENIVDTPESRNLLRRAAADAIVLLKNDAKVLPIDPSKLKRIAVIGLSAAMAHTSGGGAASVPTETFTVSPLAGIKGAVEPLGIQVDWAPGTSNYRFTPPLDPYLVGAAHPVEIEFWRSEPHAQWKDGVAGVIPSSAADHVLRVSTTKCFMHDGVPEDIINNARHVRVSPRATLAVICVYLSLTFSSVPSSRPPSLANGSLASHPLTNANSLWTVPTSTIPQTLEKASFSLAFATRSGPS